PLVSDGLIFDYSRYMDVRSRDIVLPANALRQFKLQIEQALDERESPLLELTRRRVGAAKGERVDVITQIQRRPFRIDRIELWRMVPQASALKAVTASYPVERFQIGEDAQEKVTRVGVQCRREPLTGLIVESGSRNFSRAVKVRAPLVRGIKKEWFEIAHGTI